MYYTLYIIYYTLYIIIYYYSFFIIYHIIIIFTYWTTMNYCHVPQGSFNISFITTILQ